MTGKVNGNANNKMPVILFISECTETKHFLITYPDTILMNLISAITAVQMVSHAGTSSTGINLIRQTTTKMKSAAVSNLAPNSLAMPVFRAVAPSIISERPAAAYSA